MGWGGERVLIRVMGDEEGEGERESLEVRCCHSNEVLVHRF